MSRSATEPTEGIDPERLDGATTVLVVADRASESDGRVCGDLLGIGPAVPTDFLRVAYHGTPGAVADRWATRADTRPANARVVAVGEAATLADRADGLGSPDVETVRAPGDLTSVGIAVTETISAWQANGNRTVACFDSVTDLLGHVEFETAYQFLHVLTRRLEAAGVLAHYHLDPAAHDDRTVASLKGLFDAVVTPVPDGPARISTR